MIDPELHLNIVDLGFIYGIEFPKKDKVKVKMTMTSPACPLAPYFEEEVPAVVKKNKRRKKRRSEIYF